MERSPLFVILGPTATGKTLLAIALAKKVNGEVISADSRQVYKYLNIGTAKASPEQRKEVRHHLIDLVEPHEEFSLYEYQELAYQAIQSLKERGKVPIIAGGTGLYIRAVTEGYFLPGIPANPQLRAFIQEREQKEGTGFLHRELERVDPPLARKLHPKDTRRIVRALEVYQATGVPPSRYQAQRELRLQEFRIYRLGLTMPRVLLYERINKRVEEQFSQGLLEEVQAILKEYLQGRLKEYVKRGRSPFGLKAFKTLGYAECLDHLQGKSTLEEVKALIKQHTRNFAKRQMTWFRKESGVRWTEVREDEDWEALALRVAGLCEGKETQLPECHEVALNSQEEGEEKPVWEKDSSICRTTS